ncbi:MAG: ATP-binding protein [Candidatus Electrothrix sp. YB6]
MTAIAQGIRRVLVIDDNPEIHNDIKTILQPAAAHDDFDDLLADITGKDAPPRNQLNHPLIQVDSAFQGDDGIRLVRQARLEERPYALAYVDMRIPPGLDGLQTIKELQKEDDRLQYVIITAYSDYSWQEISDSLISRDNLLVIKKPFESIEIRQSASALLEKWHIAMEREQMLAALAMQRDLLEEKVRERTKELDRKNRLLRREVEVRRKAEEQLRQHRDRLEDEVARRSAELVARNQLLTTVINSLSYPFLVVDIADYSVSLANRVTYEAAGAPPEGGRCYEYLHGLQQPCHEHGLPCPLEHIRSSGEAPVLEHTYRDRNGKEQILEIHTYPVQEQDGKSRRTIEYCPDVTRRKKLEAALIKNSRIELVASLAGGIAHDFNNLLMAIVGNIELAAMNVPENHAAFPFLRYASDASAQAKELTHKFLLFSKIDPPVCQAVPPVDLITASCRAALADSDIVPEFHFPPDLHLGYMDPGQIDLALRELLKNALESMDNTGRIIVSGENTYRSDKIHHEDETGEKGEYIRITVQDEGCGIRQEDLAHVFDPYFSRKSRGNGKGMGLGLTIAASIVQQHQGYIDIDSTPDKGTAVYIELPAATESEQT